MDSSRTPSWQERKFNLTPHERIEELEAYVIYLSHSFRKTSIATKEFLDEYCKKMTEIERRLGEVERLTTPIKFVDNNPFYK